MKYQGINNKGLEKLLDKMHNDKDFAEQLLSKKSIEEMYNFASEKTPEKSLEYSFEEFQDVMKKIFISSNKLNNDDLANVNGGLSASVWVSGILAFRNEGGFKHLSTLLGKIFPSESEKETPNNANT